MQSALDAVPGTKLLVINPNTNPAVTLRVQSAGEACATPGTRLDVVNPERGPFAIETSVDRAAAVPLVLDLIGHSPYDYDGYVMACFDDIAVAEARLALTVPVISMAEAAIRLAAEKYRRFAVITTVNAAVPTIRRLVEAYGLGDRCSFHATGIGVSETVAGTAAAEKALLATVELCRQDGADAIVLGSGAFAGRRQELSELFGMPVIDGLEAAIAFCEISAGGASRA